jgi:hypothetical protein
MMSKARWLSSITYHPGWRPTPCWAARVLRIYAIAALVAACSFVIFAALLAFISK